MPWPGARALIEGALWSHNTFGGKNIVACKYSGRLLIVHQDDVTCCQRRKLLLRPDAVAFFRCDVPLRIQRVSR
jgi:hypothetical protein